MHKRGRIELGGMTAVFIVVSSAVCGARGHLPGVLFVLLLAPVLAALVTVFARRGWRASIESRAVLGVERAVVANS